MSIHRSNTKRSKTKYGSQIKASTRWRWDHIEDKPHLTDHLLSEQWLSRTPDWAVSPEHAYDNGVSLDGVLPELADDDGREPDSARLYVESSDRHAEWYGVVFVVGENRAATVLPVHDLDNIPLREYLVALAYCRGML